MTSARDAVFYELWEEPKSVWALLWALEKHQATHQEVVTILEQSPAFIELENGLWDMKSCARKRGIDNHAILCPHCHIGICDESWDGCHTYILFQQLQREAIAEKAFYRRSREAENKQWQLLHTDPICPECQNRFPDRTILGEHLEATKECRSPRPGIRPIAISVLQAKGPISSGELLHQVRLRTAGEVSISDFLSALENDKQFFKEQEQGIYALTSFARAMLELDSSSLQSVSEERDNLKILVSELRRQVRCLEKSVQDSNTRTAMLEKQGKEKDLLIEELRHQAIILGDGLGNTDVQPNNSQRLDEVVVGSFSSSEPPVLLPSVGECSSTSLDIADPPGSIQMMRLRSSLCSSS